jgi:hypothetical protein
MTTSEAAALRSELAETRDRLARRDADIAAASDAGLSKTEIAQLTGLSRQHIYDVLARHAERKKVADNAAVAEVEAMWQIGQVIEDRWGLRWRGDVAVNSNSRGWLCRSVGLRTWRSHEKMAERGPLKKIRLDKVFAGVLGSDTQKTAMAARKAGEVEDAAVVVEPHEDSEP